jgi:hypothetical protein
VPGQTHFIRERRAHRTDGAYAYAPILGAAMKHTCKIHLEMFLEVGDHHLEYAGDVPSFADGARNPVQQFHA